jgi:hypothetical protein
VSDVGRAKPSSGDGTPEELLRRHEGFVNELLARTPDSYDNDDAAQDIALRYLRDLETEVDRLRHVEKQLRSGEKVRDGMLDMFRSGYELDRHRGAWVRVIVSYGDAEQEGHRLTPDEIAVLAALDTEEDA